MHEDLEPHQSLAKRQTNLSVRPDLVEAARSAALNLSALLEQTLEKELVRVRRRRWRDENLASIEAYNRDVKTRGCFAQIWASW
jgi:post-segregation antitoxin (ccd killing protein)